MSKLIFNIESVEISTPIDNAPTILDFDNQFDYSDWEVATQTFTSTGTDNPGTPNTSKINLGKTQGGGSFAQDIQKIEIPSDQDTDPVEILVQSAPKTLSLNLLEAEPKNLAIAFGVDPDTITGTEVAIPLSVEGVTKSLRITTKAVGGIQYIFRIPKIKFKGTTSISFTKDNASTIPLEGKVLAPTTGNPVYVSQV